MSEDFQKSVTSRKGFTIGVKPPMDQKIESWIQETSNAPAPMSLRLNSILDLFDGSHGIEVTKAVKENMRKALDDYCPLLKKRGEVSTCEAPGQDLAGPGSTIRVASNQRMTIRVASNQRLRYLSTKPDGHVDMWHKDDNSGRQKWIFNHLYDDVYNIVISGGTNEGEKYLSCRADGFVDLWSSGNGDRQKWRIQNVGEDTYTIKVLGGTNPGEEFLSCTEDGLVDLWSHAGIRQQWKLTLDLCYGTIEEGWYSGSIVQSFKQPNALQCGKSCCENENCKIWMWRSSDNACHLKSGDDPTWNAADGHWTAKRNFGLCYGTIEEGWYTGSIVESFKQSNALQCGESCCDNENCKVWVWRSSDNECQLKSLQTHEDPIWNAGDGHWTAKRLYVSFPDPKKYYYIENTRIGGSRIHGNLDWWGPGCTTNHHGHTDQMWRFEPKGSSYYIYNKHNSNHRLNSADWANNHFGMTDGGDFHPDQEWTLTFVGGNKVRITNAFNGYKLGHWDHWHSWGCGTGDWGPSDDHIWELKEV